MLPHDRPRTIFALSSGQGRAGVAVIRVSGPDVRAVVDAMAPPLPQPRVAALRQIRAPGDGDVIDQGLVLYFAAPRSETGEEVAEFQVHGGRAVIAAMLTALSSIPGCRLAEPGEFARRAFANGKIDLTAAEGLADLVDAETEAQRRQALNQAGGALARLYETWRTGLIDASALVEAAIDFSDEGDVSANTMTHALADVIVLQTAIAAHLSDGNRGEIIRDGFQVALVGAPNAGKSSLLNALARRDAAMVSPEPGTTRDVVEVRLDLGGLPVVLADTAGLRDTEGAVEQEGMRRTRERATRADLVLWVIDGSTPGTGRTPFADTIPEAAVTEARDVFVVRTKSDLMAGGAASPGVEPAAGRKGSTTDITVSALTGDGIEALEDLIAARGAARIGDREAPALTQARHRTQLEACNRSLERFLAGNLDDAELRAEDLRQASQALGRITGRVDVEDILDQVFGRFCIGK